MIVWRIGFSWWLIWARTLMPLNNLSTVKRNQKVPWNLPNWWTRIETLSRRVNNNWAVKPTLWTIYQLKRLIHRPLQLNQWKLNLYLHSIKCVSETTQCTLQASSARTFCSKMGELSAKSYSITKRKTEPRTVKSSASSNAISERVNDWTKFERTSSFARGSITTLPSFD